MFNFRSIGAKSIKIGAASVSIWLLIILFYSYHDASFLLPSPSRKINTHPQSNTNNIASIKLGARYFLDYPLKDDPKGIFGELGQRTQIIRTWIEELEHHGRDETTELIGQLIESLYPWLNSKNGLSPPLASIYDTLKLPYETTSASKVKSGSAGIVIPTGDKTLRFACHLIASLTRVHKTSLPIQVV